MTKPDKPIRVHLVAGGFPRGSHAGHDIDHARLQLLSILEDVAPTMTSVSGDYNDLGDWLPRSDLLVTYVAGPFPDEAQCDRLREWIEAGGRWVALHGTSGGKTVPLPDDRPGRMMQRAAHHELLGCFFLNHPPIRRFSVDVCDADSPLTANLPSRFEVEDELYLIELCAPDESRVLLTTSDLAADDEAPRKFGFTYDEDTSVGPDGSTRPLAYVRTMGAGAITYIALGHCHTPSTNIQPWVDESVAADGTTPLEFRGPWETKPFMTLLENAIHWGIEG
ncbi:MAG: ThuA domain-containing protein [Myxococcota bacterium]|jgi:hypothetical protein|nr:ThuA domain-containing protein [Myxococcota bacterium]